MLLRFFLRYVTPCYVVILPQKNSFQSYLPRSLPVTNKKHINTMFEKTALGSMLFYYVSIKGRKEYLSPNKLRNRHKLCL